MKSKENVKKMYKEIYRERGTGTQTDKSGQKIFEIASNLIESGKCKSVIDFGCGSCSVIRRLHKKYNVEVKGFDIVKHKDAFNTTIHDLDEIPYPIKNKSYDMVLSIGVLHALYFPQGFIKECYRILKPEGTLLLNVVNSVPFKSRIKYLFGKLDNLFYYTFHISFFDKNRLENYLHEAGFKDIKFHRVGNFSSKMKFLPSSWFSLLFVTAKKK